MLGAFALVLLAGCGNSNTGVVEEEASDGTVEAAAETKSATIDLEDGAKVTADVTEEDGKVTAVSIDEFDSDGLSKKELGDEYGMKSASAIEKEWYEQVEALENFILENGVDAVEMDADGYAENEDLKSSCTINIKNFVDAVKEAEAK
jgi:major membrane immunogen (membrane-anchored lipoprotein)